MPRVVSGHEGHVVSIVNSMGVAVPCRSSPPLSGPLTRQQCRRQRNEDWRVAHQVGVWDDQAKRLVPRPIALIAKLAGIPESTVRHGIQEAVLVLELAQADAAL